MTLRQTTKGAGMCQSGGVGQGAQHAMQARKAIDQRGSKCHSWRFKALSVDGVNSEHFLHDKHVKIVPALKATDVYS